MYTASSAFHQAVARGAHQIALLIFDDIVFTNANIDVDTGIEFNDYFNTGEDLTIGTALSNEISFSIFNDRQLLNDYEFGDFTATIGAQIQNTTVTANGSVQAQSNRHSYVAYSTSPYLKRDGAAVASQPSKPVLSMLVYEGKVYCYLTNGMMKVYNDSDGSAVSVFVNDYMKEQMTSWIGKGICFGKPSGSSNYMLTIWKGTNKRTYEFVPLGKFTAERPNVPTVNSIDLVCNDFMMKFETDWPGSAAMGITWPSTIGNLFEKLCAYVGVSYVSSSFINSAAVISAEPEEFSNATLRDILQWIAEAGAGVARFNRDGKLTIDWIRSTEQTFGESAYQEFNPYWYETKTISKLYNRGSNGSYENTVGSGTEAYLIQDNPLLKGVT